jgi:hypothetical protein
VTAAAGAVLRGVAGGCWEDGALLAACWNLHTGLLDAGIRGVQVSMWDVWYSSQGELRGDRKREDAL